MKKPWYWKARKQWYLDTDEGRIPLGEDEEEAFEVWGEIRAESKRKASGELRVRDVISQYVRWAKNEVKIGQLSENTLEDYRKYFVKFLTGHADMLISDLQPSHVTDWIADRPSWGPSSQAHAIRSLNRAFNWAAKEKRIKENPIRGKSIPRQRRRKTLVPIEVHERLVRAAGSGKYDGRIDRQFRLILIAIRHCGGRPQDPSNVRVEHVNRDRTRWTIPTHKTERYSDQPRVVYLSPCLQTVTKMLIGNRKDGPLFQNRRGAVSVNSITCRMKKLKKKLNITDDIVSYAYRHTYITEAMERGVDIATVAELVGTSVITIQKHYGHLEQKKGHLDAAALQAVTRVK